MRVPIIGLTKNGDDSQTVETEKKCMCVCVHRGEDGRTKCSSSIVGSQEIISKTDFKNSGIKHITKNRR